MNFSRRKFKISELVRLTDSFQQERKKDSNILKCKIGIILGCCEDSDLGYLYKVHWIPISKIFYDEQSRLERL
tara:strand:- start:522 stop:740 length:219 start_codon:yes stop_codon:yes gene_type:complete